MGLGVLAEPQSPDGPPEALKKGHDRAITEVLSCQLWKVFGVCVPKSAVGSSRAAEWHHYSSSTIYWDKNECQSIPMCQLFWCSSCVWTESRAVKFKMSFLKSNQLITHFKMINSPVNAWIWAPTPCLNMFSTVVHKNTNQIWQPIVCGTDQQSETDGL